MSRPRPVSSRAPLLAVLLTAGSLRAADAAVWTCHHDRPDQPATYTAYDRVPPGAPPISPHFDTLRFTGRYANYTRADTWYPTWAADGNLYSPWTDGTIGAMDFVWSARRAQAQTGYATIVGDDPLALTVRDWGVRVASALPFQGRYPCGSLAHDGVWYYGTYGLDQVDPDLAKRFGWYVLGPLVGFRWSTDRGRTWQETPHAPDRPLFPEPPRERLDLHAGRRGPFIRMGAPHFVDFGRNMVHSPDGKAYLVGHGAAWPDPQPRPANNSWITGDAIFLARVTPSIATINDAEAWEFFAGHAPDGTPRWTHDFRTIQPIFTWNNHAGCVTVTYNAPLRRYLLCVSDGHRGDTSRDAYTSYLLESDRITGPWRLVAHLVDFGPQAYFLNIPSKFISGGGRTMWLCYSANYMAGERRNDPTYLETTTPPGSAYALSLHEFRLERTGPTP